MVLGQHLDIESESKDLNIKDIDNIYSLKTGRLIECSVMLGQINNNDDKIKKILYSFGKKIGLDFEADTLCTIELSKKNFPDLKSYKLKKICDHFSIELNNHHRAFDDAKATLELFKINRKFEKNN